MKSLSCFSVLIITLMAIATGANAQSAAAVWTTVIKKCAMTNEIGHNVAYFGGSNTLGAGSVWGRGRDGTYTVMFRPADPFPRADMSQYVTTNAINPCTGNSSTKWNLSLGLPFTASNNALSADLAVTLGRASSVTVSINGYAIDNLVFGNWFPAILALGPTNRFYQMAIEGNYLVSANAVRVEGMKVVFNYNTPLSANVTANLSKKQFNTGSNGMKIGLDFTSSHTITVMTPTTAVYILAEMRRIHADSVARPQIAALIRGQSLRPTFGLPNFTFDTFTLPTTTKFNLNATAAPGHPR